MKKKPCKLFARIAEQIFGPKQNFQAVYSPGSSQLLVLFWGNNIYLIIVLFFGYL